MYAHLWRVSHPGKHGGSAAPTVGDSLPEGSGQVPPARRAHPARCPALADEVDLDSLAAQTPGMVGADLANLVSEAALVAARRGQRQVTRDDFGAAFERIVL